MPNYIYVNGDSFSDATHYLDNPEDCWPYKLLEYKTQIINDACGGGSNYRIMRTTLAMLPRICNNTQHAIFAWTDWSRYEMPGPGNGDNLYHRCGPHNAPEEILLENFLDQILNMNALCDALRVNAWHMHSIATPDLTMLDELTRQRLTHKINQLDPRRWIIPFNSSICQWAKENNVEFDSTGHLSANGNSTLGKLVKSKIYE